MYDPEPPPFDFASAAATLRDLVETEDAKALTALIDRLADELVLAGHAEPLYTALLDALASPFVRALPVAASIVALFHAPAWDDLTPDQRQRFIESAEAAYPHFAEWMACFRITELLGDDLDTERSLAVLQRLRRVPQEVPRSLVPNGLDGLARNHADPVASQAALKELLLMWSDSSRAVRGEVLESLGRIVGRLQSSGRHPLAGEKEALLKTFAEWSRAFS